MCVDPESVARNASATVLFASASTPTLHCTFFFKKKVQRDIRVGVEAEAKRTVVDAFRATDSGSTHTIQP